MKGGFIIGTILSDTTGVYIDNALANVDFAVVLNEIVAAAPILLPSLIAIIGFKKALRWVVGSVKGS